MSKKKIIQALVVFAALVAVIRFRNEIGGLLAKVPGVNKLAGVA